MIKAYQQFELFGKKIIEKAVIEPPFRIMAEMPNEACFYYIVEGQANVITPTETITTKTNEGLVLRCGNYLNEYFAAQEISYCEAIAVHLYPEVLKIIYDKEFPGFLLHVQKIKPVMYESIPPSSFLKSYIDSLQFYFNNPALVSDELIKLKIKELILLLAKTDNAATVKMLLSGLFSKTEISFKAIIEANLFNNLSLEELAMLNQLSLSSFKREFVKQYDCSPAKYIKQRKLEQAAKLLQGTSLRVSAIAFDCGFIDLAHFSKSFQKAYGTSPSDFRKDQINKSLN